MTHDNSTLTLRFTKNRHLYKTCEEFISVDRTRESTKRKQITKIVCWFQKLMTYDNNKNTLENQWATLLTRHNSISSIAIKPITIIVSAVVQRRRSEKNQNNNRVIFSTVAAIERRTSSTVTFACRTGARRPQHAFAPHVTRLRYRSAGATYPERRRSDRRRRNGARVVAADRMSRTHVGACCRTISRRAWCSRGTAGLHAWKAHNRNGWSRRGRVLDKGPVRAIRPDVSKRVISCGGARAPRVRVS